MHGKGGETLQTTYRKALYQAEFYANIYKALWLQQLT